MRSRYLPAPLLAAALAVAASAALPGLASAPGPAAAAPLSVAPITANGTSTPLPFNAANAQAYVRSIVSFGVRTAGSRAESRTADYAVRQLRSWGYRPTVQLVKLPSGRYSRNVVAVKPGRSARRVVIGGHMDAKSPSPGGNDNGSGSAVTLELARDFARSDTVPTLVFVLFGAEESQGAYPWQHHFGSKRFVSLLSSTQRSWTAGMVSVDMVGYGTRFNTRTMGLMPDTISDQMLSRAKAKGMPASYLRDASRYGQSDHEAFEHAGVPAVWLEWREDTMWHTSGDTASRVSWSKLLATGTLLRSFVTTLTQTQMASWRRD